MCLDVFLELVPFHFRTYCFLALFPFLLLVCFFSSSFFFFASPSARRRRRCCCCPRRVVASARTHKTHTRAHTQIPTHRHAEGCACAQLCVRERGVCGTLDAASPSAGVCPMCTQPRKVKASNSLPPSPLCTLHSTHTYTHLRAPAVRVLAHGVCAGPSLPPSFSPSPPHLLCACVWTFVCVCVCTRVCLRAAVPLRAALGACRRARPSGCEPSSLRVPSPSRSSPHTSSSCPPALSSSPSLPPRTHTHPSHGSPCHSRL